MVSVGRHENIKLLSYSEVESVSGYVGNYSVKVRRKARFIDETLCTGCGQCAEVCPVETSNPFDMGLSIRKAVYRHSAQSVPNAYTIQKRGIAPCRDACPTDQRAQGYIALIRQGRYADAYWAIRREHPFPSVCGRVCNHQCEDACSRGKFDEPVNIMGLKRFVADWAYQHRDELPNMRDKSIVGTPFSHKPKPSGKKVAVIGAGPAGLTAALDLVRLGHRVTVFDSLPVAGGMMRVGIPPHRLPVDRLEWEIQQIVDEGVEVRLNTWVDDIPGLLENGYQAVLIATGAHVTKKLPIRNSNHPDNLLSLEVLRRACIGERDSKGNLDLTGRKVIILGGGNVALDTARTVIRLGAEQVRMVCLEPRGEMPGFQWEISVAEEEGIEMCPGRTFKEIVVFDDRIVGVRCSKILFHGFKRGRPDFEELPGTDHILPGDLVVWAVGQTPNFSFLPADGSINTRFPVGVQADDNMMTTMPGVFVAGDVRRGVTFYVVDAIGEGHNVARNIDLYLKNKVDDQVGFTQQVMPAYKKGRKLPVVKLSTEEIGARIQSGQSSSKARVPISSIPVGERHKNFREVDLTLTEEQAIHEAERCLSCGICSECLECLAACQRGAINHDMPHQFVEVNVGAIVLATGFKDFDPVQVPELNYGNLEDIITAMEFERMINTSGPTNGRVVCSNGRKPESVAIVHCVGSRDDRFHEYCSRACCMYSLKIAQLVHEYVQAEVHEIYRDMRAFGKGYEEFYNRVENAGVHFYHGRVKGIERINGKLRVSWNEAYYGQPDHINVDMVILATGFEPQGDADSVASLFGVSRSRDGFFLERHPKLAPVETASEGIYLAGACQSPKDIPDSIAQAGGAAAAALSLIDQGTISLDPSIAQVMVQRCAGCGQCVTACPYEAIELLEGVARVNEYACKGCGTCVAACPNKAMSLDHFTDRQIIEEMMAALATDTLAGRVVVPGVLSR